VQVSDSAIQLGQEYVYDPGADFVLVVSSATSDAEIARWTALAARLGSRVSVWNVSLYGGIDFLFVRRDGGCFDRELQVRGRIESTNCRCDAVLGVGTTLRAVVSRSRRCCKIGAQGLYLYSCTPPPPYTFTHPHTRTHLRWRRGAFSLC
jgi:hypothetical protein